MRNPRTLALGLAGALAALLPAPSPASAQEEAPRFCRSIRKAVEIAKERGHPIFVWCNTDGEGDNVADQALMKDASVRKAMRGFLVCYGNDKITHGSVDGQIDGKPAKVCKLAPGIACEDHKAIIDSVYTTYGDVAVNKNSEMKLPVHFVVDGDGKVVATINNGTKDSGFSKIEPGKLADGLKSALSKVGGPGLTDEQYDGFQKALAAARNAIEQKRMTEAGRLLIPIVEITKNIAIVKDARELLGRVDKAATPALARAQSLLKDDPVAGLAALEKVIADFPGTESAFAARKAADAFKASPEGKKALAALAREKQGRAELDKAVAEAGDGKDDAKLLRLLDSIAKRYDGVPCAADAKAQADAVRNDPARMQAIEAAAKERDARAALTAAKGLLDAGKKDDAKKALEAILAKYPGTKAAEEAKGLLEGVR
jgi:hypothetical protein